MYGDHFTSGDTVGVLLDMNRGRLCFFLDGIKYGQHSISDLGEAFDHLAAPNQVRPRALYPIVGLSKNQDRVAITPRWLSVVGLNVVEEVQLITRAHEILHTWADALPPSPHPLSGSSSTATLAPSSPPLSRWLLRAAWRDWCLWRSERFTRVRSRCSTRGCGPLIAVDTTVRACVEASMRLGLPFAYFRGDRIVISLSAGRPLDQKEEAVVLGAYGGKLWYRLDSQQGGGELTESASFAWCLAPNDVEGITLLRRHYVISSLGAADSNSDSNADALSPSRSVSMRSRLAQIPLPRIPMFQAGLVHVTYSNGAVMRDGLEIDTSDVLCSVPFGTVLYAVEQRLNSSNVWRLRVIYGEFYGWISERMRGGSEEVNRRKWCQLGRTLAFLPMSI